MIWRSISRVINPGKQYFYRRQIRLIEAYKAVFQGSPSKEDQEIVLADLMTASGRLRVVPSSASDATLRMQEGSRALFAHIWSFLSLSGSDVAAIENASRTEAAYDINNETLD